MKTNLKYILSGCLLAAGIAALAQYGQGGSPPRADGHEQMFPKTNKITPERKAELQALRAPAYEMLARAQQYFRAGDLDAAEAACRRSIRMAPVIDGQVDDPPLGARPLLAQIDMKRGNYKTAATEFEQAAKGEWYAGMNLDMALCYLRAGRQADARRFYSDKQILQYSKITKADLPGVKDTRSFEASILMAKGLDEYFSAQDDQAVGTLQEALNIVPKNGVVAYFIGMSLVHLERREDALPYFRKAASLKTDLGKDARYRAGLPVEPTTGR